MSDRDDSQAIHLSLIINKQTLSTNRNEEEKLLAIDISDNEDFNSQTIKLSPNNAEGNNPKSIKVLDNIESFFYLYSAYPADLILTKQDNTSIVLTVENITLLSGAFLEIIIVNRNTTQSLSIKTIYS